MPQGYAIIATSSQGHRQKKIDLTTENAPITDAGYAQRLAESYADEHNRLGTAGHTDWVGSIEWCETGITTLPGYNGLTSIEAGSQHTPNE